MNLPIIIVYFWILDRERLWIRNLDTIIFLQFIYLRHSKGFFGGTHLRRSILVDLHIDDMQFYQQ